MAKRQTIHLPARAGNGTLPGLSSLRRLALCCCLLAPLAQAEVLQDPTAPLAGTGTKVASDKQASAALPRLQSIVLGSGPALAVLNGQSYRVGQRVDGYQLISIGADAVVLEKGGKRQTLTLFGSKVRI